MKKPLKVEFIGQLLNMNSVLWGGHIIVDENIVKSFKAKVIKRVIVTLNDLETFHAALMPKGDGQTFILINKERAKKLNLRFSDEVSVQLEEDKSEFGMFMPAEFQELMDQDIEVENVFRSLTPGKQRSLLHLIGKPKGVETRIKKAIVIGQHLKTHNGNIDFKLLNEEYKNYSF